MNNMIYTESLPIINLANEGIFLDFDSSQFSKDIENGLKDPESVKLKSVALTNKLAFEVGIKKSELSLFFKQTSKKYSGKNLDTAELAFLVNNDVNSFVNKRADKSIKRGVVAFLVMLTASILILLILSSFLPMGISVILSSIIIAPVVEEYARRDAQVKGGKVQSRAYTAAIISAEFFSKLTLLGFNVIATIITQLLPTFIHLFSQYLTEKDNKYSQSIATIVHAIFNGLQVAKF
jgi:hypothetical protein